MCVFLERKSRRKKSSESLSQMLLDFEKTEYFDYLEARLAPFLVRAKASNHMQLDC